MINPPFNYTGSKYKLLNQILPLFDYSRKFFFDVFLGGGSVAYNVLDKYELVYANDIISELVKIHEGLVFDSESFLEKTKEICSKIIDKSIYYEIRKIFNEHREPECLYALILTCTNNMIRFNNDFEFNQTYGDRNYNISTIKKIKEFLLYLDNRKNIKFQSKDFGEIKPMNDCFYYLDPPYLNTQAGYNCYWSSENENKLYDFVHEINSSTNSSFALSGVFNYNGKTSELLNKLSSDFKMIELNHNYDGVSRIGKKEVSEVLIVNYDVKIEQNTISDYF